MNFIKMILFMIFVNFFFVFCRDEILPRNISEIFWKFDKEQSECDEYSCEGMPVFFENSVKIRLHVNGNDMSKLPLIISYICNIMGFDGLHGHSYSCRICKLRNRKKSE